jgi:multiple antibiotic resistance protein
VEFFQVFFAAFMPLFFAIDAPGILPAFLSVTSEISLVQRRRVVLQATLTAIGVSIFFIYLGKFIFKMLAISVADFKVAGGILLLIFAVHDLLFSTGERRKKGTDNSTVGVVPVGIPLIIGPGVLTTLLISVESFGYSMTFASIVLNLIIVYVIFYYSDLVIKVLTKAGSIAIGKVFNLFLAAISIRLIRSGITEMMNM